MNFKQFQKTKQFKTLINYDNEEVQGYSYATINYPIYEGETNPSKFCEEHHWIAKINDKYHLILCNADFLDADLPKLEKMLFEFIYGEMGFDESHKKEIIKSLDNAVESFRDFIELSYEGEYNLDESYPKHTSETNFTDKSFDDFLVSLMEYRNHLECCFEEK